MNPCPRCRQLVVYMTPQCPHCGQIFGGAGVDDPAMRMLLPVGRTPLSIIAGYLGILSLFLVFGPLALAVGIWAIVDLKHKPGKHGLGRAIFAVVMGGLATILLGVVLLFG